ncbi:hypothetical protein [Reyranella sp.]|uniref:hypothetical protein n=1 Tax=Reyranella sp. TaxID=1929291 RepID=UPI003F702A75
MTATSRKIQRAGRCVFCNGTGLTKEHIWSDWLKHHLPQTAAHSQMTMPYLYAPGVALILPVAYTQRQGSPGQRKIRRVCARCNGGWMKNAVDRAKPIVERLLRNEGSSLAPSECDSLSAWCAISCVMAEFTDERTAAIPSADRAFLLANEKPPPEWTICLGRHDIGARWGNYRYRHHGLKALPPGRSIPDGAGDVVGAAHNQAQISTFALGAIAFQVFTSTSPELVARYRALIPARMFQIFPASINLQWPPSDALDDDALDRVADWFWGDIFKDLGKRRLSR